MHIFFSFYFLCPTDPLRAPGRAEGHAEYDTRQGCGAGEDHPGQEGRRHRQDYRRGAGARGARGSHAGKYCTQSINTAIISISFYYGVRVNDTAFFASTPK